MNNTEQKFNDIIDNIMKFSFEFDFKEIQKEMKLQEVPQDRLDELGKEKVLEYFKQGIFIIKLTDSTFIDVNSLEQHCLKNNIAEPVLYVNPDFRYVEWVLNKDFTEQQLKNYIKNQLANNTDLDLKEFKKKSIIEDIRENETIGFINELPVKSSDFITLGKFYVQSTVTRNKANQLINEVLNELEKEEIYYVKSKIKRDNIYCGVYFFVVIVLFILNLVTMYYAPNRFSNIFTVVIFLNPFLLRLINVSFIYVVFSKKEAEKKYIKEFRSRVI